MLASVSNSYVKTLSQFRPRTALPFGFISQSDKNTFLNSNRVIRLTRSSMPAFPYDPLIYGDDKPENAQWLGIVDQRGKSASGSVTGTLPKFQGSVILKKPDVEDWYKFEVARGGGNIAIILNGMRANANFEVYEQVGEGSLTRGFPTFDGGGSRPDGLVGGRAFAPQKTRQGANITYYLRVLSVRGANTEYTISAGLVS